MLGLHITFLNPHSYFKSMLMRKSPLTICWCLSGALNPARSSISLLASSCTYSLFAEVHRSSNLDWALTALIPRLWVICSNIYFCTSGFRSIRLALTLELFPLYPATLDASVIVQPVATSVSTNFFARGVILLSLIATDILFIYQYPLKKSTYCSSEMKNQISSQGWDTAEASAVCDKANW